MAVKRNKVRALRYKVHNAIDADSRIILDSKKTTGACHDSVPFLSQLEEVESRYSLEIKEVVADRAYGSGSILVQLEQKNIKAFIPLFNTITGRTYDLEKEGFKFDPNKDVYLCPENKIMSPYKSKNNNQLRIKYRASKKDCASCIRTDSCQTGFKSTVIGKHIVRSAYQATYEKVLKNINEQEFIDRRNERFWKGEGIFAEAKNNHLLGQTRYRGLDKTQVQATIIATGQNIKRLIKHYENNCPK